MVPTLRSLARSTPSSPANPSDNYTELLGTECCRLHRRRLAGRHNPSFSGGPGKGIWLYVNPKGEARRWDRYEVVDDYQSELGYVAKSMGRVNPRPSMRR